jgi:hypothetical protein
LNNPSSYADTPFGIESMVLQLIDVRRFFVIPPLPRRNTTEDWLKFASTIIHHTCVKPVAKVMLEHDELGKDWSNLIGLLRMFNDFA